MSLRVIEISKGMKPEGNVIKFGGTSEYDFYIKSEGKVEKFRWSNESFLDDFGKAILRKNFEYSKQYVDWRNEQGLY